MEKPTQDLFEEHGGIILMLKIMGKVAERLKKGEEVKREHLNKIVEFLRNFADKCHHGKEEGILFPEIAKNKFNVQMIYEFLGEHKSGRDYIRGIAEGLRKKILNFSQLRKRTFSKITGRNNGKV